MNRRQFMVLGGVSTLGLAVGSAAWRVGGVWWDQKPGEGRQVLSGDEVQIAESIAEALFPGDHEMPAGDEVGVIETLDGYLAAIPSQKANLLRLLLHAIDEMAVPSDLGLTRFRNRSLEERIEILNAWDDSWIGVRREAFEALKMVLSMGYCESPQVLEAAGIDYECGGIQ